MLNLKLHLTRSERNGLSKFMCTSLQFESSDSDTVITPQNSPVMIEVGARLAGGRKAIMAQQTIPNWQPFDAMVDAHCGFPVRMPPSFKPDKFAIQAYVSADKTGILKNYHGDDFERLPTYNSHIILKNIGEEVKPARELMSFAAYVWLIGQPEDIRRDANRARDEFFVDVELEPLSETPSK